MTLKKYNIWHDGICIEVEADAIEYGLDTQRITLRKDGEVVALLLGNGLIAEVKDE